MYYKEYYYHKRVFLRPFVMSAICESGSISTVVKLSRELRRMINTKLPLRTNTYGGVELYYEDIRSAIEKIAMLFFQKTAHKMNIVFKHVSRNSSESILP